MPLFIRSNYSTLVPGNLQNSLCLSGNPRPENGTFLGHSVVSNTT
jgi:hypothetical protein